MTELSPTGHIPSGVHRGHAGVAYTAGLVAPPLFAGLTLLAGLLRPGYDPVRQTVSALAVGPGGWLQTAGFVLLGTLSLVFAAGLAYAMPHRRAAWAVGLLTGVLGLLALAFAVFPTNGPGESGTLHGRVHNALVTLLAFYFPVAVFGVALALRHAAAWRRMAAFSAVVGVVTLALALVWLAVPADVSRAWKGLYERVWIGVQLVWLEGMALGAWARVRAPAAGGAGSAGVPATRPG